MRLEKYRLWGATALLMAASFGCGAEEGSDSGNLMMFGGAGGAAGAGTTGGVGGTAGTGVPAGTGGASGIGGTGGSAAGTGGASGVGMPGGTGGAGGTAGTMSGGAGGAGGMTTGGAGGAGGMTTGGAGGAGGDYTMGPECAATVLANAPEGSTSEECAACLCEKCPTELKGCYPADNPTWTGQCRALVQCGKTSPCCGTGCYGSYDFATMTGDGPCVEEVYAAGGGKMAVEGFPGSCSMFGPPPANACAASNRFGLCTATNCKAECGSPCNPADFGN